MVFLHENWNASDVDFVGRMAAEAAKRKFEDFTLCPVLTWSNDAIASHLDSCLAIPGEELAFGGKPITGAAADKVPPQYGLFEPTAVRVPIDSLLADEKYFATATTELFGPFQVIVDYKEGEIDHVLALLNAMEVRAPRGLLFLFLTSFVISVCPKPRPSADYFSPPPPPLPPNTAHT